MYSLTKVMIIATVHSFRTSTALMTILCLSFFCKTIMNFDIKEHKSIEYL